jgi:hypothetical protein
VGGGVFKRDKLAIARRREAAGGSIGEVGRFDEISMGGPSFYRSLRISMYQRLMERRAVPRKHVLMLGAIAFAGRTINCLIRDISVSGAALDVTSPHNIPECFNLVFRADGTRILCHVIWRQEERIGVAFD